MRTLIIFIFLAHLFSDASGFNRKNHRKISRTAMRGYLSKTTQHHITRGDIRAFVKGSAYEDQPIEWLEKFGHQHFFRSDVALEPNRTFTSRIDELMKELQALKKDDHKKYWNTVGKIAHYYQDMACPPHVIPIYHMGSDAFDGQKIDEEKIPIPGTTITEIDAFAAMSWQSLITLQADLTFKALAAPLPLEINGSPQTVTWNLFWTRDTVYKHDPSHEVGLHFGAYGEAGNNFMNTKKDFSCEPIGLHANSNKFFKDTYFPCNGSGRKFTVKKEEYEKFRDARLMQAVAGSMALVHWAVISRLDSK